MTNSASTSVPTDDNRKLFATGLAILGAILLGLFYFKWGSSLAAVQSAARAGSTTLDAAPYLEAGLLDGTLNYLGKVWIALAFGVAIAATMRVAVPTTQIARWMGGRGAANMARGALAGLPLMLCSCCVTPIFSSIHQRGARLGPALAVLLAAPGLNLAALALTFVLFPPGLAVGRALAALLLVFGGASLIGRFFEGGRVAKGLSPTCAVEPDPAIPPGRFLVTWFRSLVTVALTTVPMVVVGVMASSVLGPVIGSLSVGGTVLVVFGVALVATLLALPTFFEIPIALTLSAAGADGAALAVLIAGPIINLPSLFIVAREASPRVALLLFTAVWLVASLAGVALS